MGRLLRHVGAGALLAAGGLAVAPVGRVQAASTVNVTTTVDAAPGPCSTSGTGTCSLRDAVVFANNHPGTTINIQAGTYLLNHVGNFENAALTGDLDITASVTIHGAGQGATIIDGNHTDIAEPAQNRGRKGLRLYGRDTFDLWRAWLASEFCSRQ